MDTIENTERLRETYGPPSERSLKKQLSRFDKHCRDFIARSPFLVIASSDPSGRCDASPKGDAPGFVQVLDDTRLVVPERNGNKRLDGMKNLLANPHVGLIFILPGSDYTLRVNGRASITRDPALLSPMTVQGVTPQLAVGVHVESTFFHCSKAFLRSRLWKHETWPDLGTLPSYACALFTQIKPSNATLIGA